jgi:DNA-binding beta-propeller fold protein YncE
VGNGPAAILPDANGSYVYVANTTDNDISGFSLSAGALTALTDSPFETAKAPFAMVEDSTKTYVLTLGSGNNPDLWVYTFDTASVGTLDVASTLSTGTTDPSGAVALAITH